MFFSLNKCLLNVNFVAGTVVVGVGNPVVKNSGKNFHLMRVVGSLDRMMCRWLERSGLIGKIFRS